MAKQIFETRDGLKKLQDELAFRKGPERNRIEEAIAVAKGFGDLSENSEYDEAREQQAKNEHRILELEEMLKNTVVIEENEASADKITLGKTVKVRNESNGKEYVYHMVGSTEADPQNGLISDESPVGKALLGKKLGDEVIVEAPGGEFKLKIIEISK